MKILYPNRTTCVALTDTNNVNHVTEEKESKDQFVNVAKNTFSTIVAFDDNAGKIARLANIFPQTIKCLNGGDNHVYLVDKKWIFRFPKSENAKMANIREQHLLKLLASRVKSTAIPQYEFFDKDEGAGGYKEIVGKSLSRAVFFKLSSDEQNQLAVDCARVLSEIHSLPLTQLGSQIRDLKSTALENFQNTQKLLDGNLNFASLDREKIALALNTAKDLLIHTQPVLLHADLHCENVIFDNSKKQLAGLIDFSDARLGPCIVDFSSFYRLDGHFAERLIREYASINNLDEKNLINNARAWSLAHNAGSAMLYENASTPHQIRRLLRASQALKYLLACE